MAKDTADYRHLVDLFARVLSSGLEHLLKRGLDQGYREHRETVAGVRGRIDFAVSLKAHLFPLGRAACIFEELTHDVPHNQILKRTVADLFLPFNPSGWSEDGLRPVSASRLGPRKAETTSR